MARVSIGRDGAGLGWTGRFADYVNSGPKLLKGPRLPPGFDPRTVSGYEDPLPIVEIADQFESHGTTIGGNLAVARDPHHRAM